MQRLEFFITRQNGAFCLLDAHGNDHCGLRFASAEIAADVAVRLAQELGALYVIHY
jgi:hypothetical protein